MRSCGTVDSTPTRSSVTRGFSLKSLNQQPEITQLLAKLPDGRRARLVEHEQSAPLTDEHGERTDDVAAGIWQFALAGEVEDRLADLVAIHHPIIANSGQL